MLCAVALNTAAVVRFPTPSMVKLALSVSPVPVSRVKVKVLPVSGSTALSVPTVVPIASPSATVELESVMSVGASLAFVTVIVNCFSNARPF